MDHMVIQQRTKLPIWGSTAPGKEVLLMAGWGEKVKIVSDRNGKWMAKLHTPSAGGPFKITIKTERDSIAIEDVLVGEVWLASGQSNMDLPLKGWPPRDTVMNGQKEIRNADYPMVRFFKVGFNVAASPQDSMAGAWTPVSPTTAGDLGATAYFYALRLFKELKVPIGIIQSSIGGTPVEAWSSARGLKNNKNYEEKINALQTLQTSKTDWKNKWESYPRPVDAMEWNKLSFNDDIKDVVKSGVSNWKSVNFPGRFDRLLGEEFDGVVWSYKEFMVTDLSDDYELHLDAVDDIDVCYVNGKKIGESYTANLLRRYKVPKSALHVGKNILTLRLTDTGGPGSIMGEMFIRNGKGTSISLSGKWNCRAVAELIDGRVYTYGLSTDISHRPTLSEMNSNSPTVLFNAMVHPLVSYPVKGVIWYQGESNVGRAEEYKTLFPNMIKDWRDFWHEKFPFYYVQIAPYNYTDPLQKEQSQKLRNAQRLALSLPKTGMVTTLDIGRLDSAHPSQKKEVGDRLANFALSNNYNRPAQTSGPLFKSAKNNSGQIIISFETASLGSGLVLTSNSSSGLEVAGEDTVFYKAEGKVVGKKLAVWSDRVFRPLYVRYAWSDGAIGTIFNTEGLPASTFSSLPQDN